MRLWGPTRVAAAGHTPARSPVWAATAALPSVLVIYTTKLASPATSTCLFICYCVPATASVYTTKLAANCQRISTTYTPRLLCLSGNYAWLSFVLCCLLRAVTNASTRFPKLSSYLSPYPLPLGNPFSRSTLG